MNQCDGCKLGLPIENGIHVHPGQTGYNRFHMTCTKERYEEGDRMLCGHLKKYQYFHPTLIGPTRWRCQICDNLKYNHIFFG